MYCDQCGSLIAATARFCAQCGKGIATTPKPPARLGLGRSSTPITFSPKFLYLVVALVCGAFGGFRLGGFAGLILFVAISLAFYIRHWPMPMRWRLGVLGAFALAIAITWSLEHYFQARNASIAAEQLAESLRLRRLAEEEFQRKSPSEHLNAARGLVTKALTPAIVADAFKHLGAIPSSAAEFKEAQKLRDETSQRVVEQQNEIDKKWRQQTIAQARAKIGARDYVNAEQLLLKVTTKARNTPEGREAYRLFQQIHPKAVAATAKAVAAGEAARQAADLRSGGPGDDALAQIRCEQAVTASLKAPSTADFASHWDTETRYEGNAIYVVTSYVDAQNSYGAQLRMHFECRVLCVSRDRCSVVGIKTW